MGNTLTLPFTNISPAYFSVVSAPRPPFALQSAAMILLTNDDGFQSEGLLALREAALRAFLGENLVIVAPSREQSQIGHRVTTDTPLELRRHGEELYCVSGTPADCVRVALFGLSLRPRLVLSGVNHGGNLGHDIPISGTIAAIREAAYHGVPGIAFSQYLRHDIPVDWASATGRVERVLQDLATRLRPEGLPFSYNVNLPCLPEGADEPAHHDTTPSRYPLPVTYREIAARTSDDTRHFQYTGSYPSRQSESGSDVACCFGGDISISRLDLIPAGIYH